MVYGDLPQNGIGDPSKFLFPRGVILDKNLAEVLPRRSGRSGAESRRRSAHSWYKYPDGKAALHPWDGVTEPNYTGPKPPYQAAGRNGGYSWLKAPRWKGHAMEVGPLVPDAGRLCQRAAGVQRGGDGGAGHN